MQPNKDVSAELSARRGCGSPFLYLSQLDRRFISVAVFVALVASPSAESTGTSCRSDLLQPPLDGQMSPSDPLQTTWLPGFSVNFTCDTNFFITLGDKSKLLADWSIMCLENGSWSSAVPRCKSIPCGKPEDADNAVVSVTIDSPTSAKVAYQCNDNYLIAGTAHSARIRNRELTCSGSMWQTGGSWPRCEPLSCGQPPRPPQLMTLSGRFYTVGMSVTYTCRQGFVVADEPRVVTHISLLCLASGKWNSSVPSAGCRLHYCSSPNITASHADVAFTPSLSTAYGSLATFTCHPGHVLAQNHSSQTTVATCTLAGWNENAACVPTNVSCRKPKMPIAFRRVSGLSFAVGATVNYTCLRGFILAEANRSSPPFISLRCLPDGNWSKVAPQRCIFNKTMSVSPSRAVAVEGDHILLTCEADIDPSLFFHWTRRSGAQLRETMLIDTATGRLVLSNITLLDQDGYICQLRSGAEIVPGTVRQANVTVLEPPVVTVHTMNRSPAVEGDHVTINCTAVGSQPFVFSWRRQSGTPLPVTAQWSSTSGIFVIPSVTVRDADVYECNVSSKPVHSLSPDKSDDTGVTTLDVIPSVILTEETVFIRITTAGQTHGGGSKSLYLYASIGGGVAIGLLFVLLLLGYRAFKRRTRLPANWPRVVRTKSNLSHNSGDIIRRASSLSELFDDPIYSSPRNNHSSVLAGNGELRGNKHFRMNGAAVLNNNTTDAHSRYVSQAGEMSSMAEFSGVGSDHEMSPRFLSAEHAQGARSITQFPTFQAAQEVMCEVRSRTNTDTSTVKGYEEQENVPCKLGESYTQDEYSRIEQSMAAATNAAEKEPSTNSDVERMPRSQLNMNQLSLALAVRHAVSPKWKQSNHTGQCGVDGEPEVVYSTINVEDQYSPVNEDLLKEGDGNANTELMHSTVDDCSPLQSMVDDCPPLSTDMERPYSSVNAEDAYRSISGAPLAERSMKETSEAAVLTNPYAVTNLPANITGRLGSSSSEWTLPMSPLYFEVRNEKSVPVKKVKADKAHSATKLRNVRSLQFAAELSTETLTPTPELVLRRCLSTPLYFTLETDRSAADGTTSSSDYGELNDLPPFRVHSRVKYSRQDTLFNISSDELSGTDTELSMLGKEKSISHTQQKSLSLDKEFPVTKADDAETEGNLHRELGMVFSFDSDVIAKPTQPQLRPNQRKTFDSTCAHPGLFKRPHKPSNFTRTPSSDVVNTRPSINCVDIHTDV